MVRFSRQRLIQNLPTWGGGAAAALAALCVLVVPDWRLETAVSASGLSAVLPFAAPPLGLTARALLMVAAAVLTGAVVWSALFLVWGPGGALYRAPEGDAPTVRRADAHPDAPPRRPMSAADLGVPPPPSVQPVPADLDQPLAAYHPGAIPDVPLEPIRAVPAMAAVSTPEPEPEEVVAQDAGPEMTRIETFELTPMVRPPRPASRDETVEALLQRLERVTRARTGTAG